MSSKKWLVMFIGAVLLVLMLCVGVNLLIDPFGVYGDPLFHWASYSDTINPRVGKINWLEEHHNEYDSYIIGSSSAASYSVDALNKYLDANFYNLFVYGTNTQDYRDFAAYLLENYSVRNIVLNLGINEANTALEAKSGLTERMHARVNGESMFPFYLSYAFATPKYAMEKVSSFYKDKELPQPFDVFLPKTGCYDKRVRDIQKIGDPEVYNAAYGASFQVNTFGQTLLHIEQCVKMVSEIRDMCQTYGVNLIVIMSPVYQAQWNAYTKETLAAYKMALAQEVDYWDFSLTSLSYDSRYFYDATHFRNATGDMVLGEIFGDDQIYRPAEFGNYITKNNCQEWIDKLHDTQPVVNSKSYSINVPILLYHHFTDADTAESSLEVTAQNFEMHVRTLVDAGYHTVTSQQLMDYVYHGTPLPEHPIMITIDDGYLSNYDIAYPILEKYGLSATIFPIGVSLGHKEFYKDTEYPITPHFGFEEAEEMLLSGVIDIQSHTYDMHQWEQFEGGDEIRTSILPLDGENEAAYEDAVLTDLATYQSLWQEQMGRSFCALAYPGGSYNEFSEVLLHENGIPITYSTRTDSKNVIVKGLPQTLYALCRWNITNDTTAEELLHIVDKT